MAPMPSTNIEPQIKKQKTTAKYSDYIRLEKMRKFKRMPKLIGQRNPV